MLFVQPELLFSEELHSAPEKARLKEMAGIVTKLLYIVVIKDEKKREEEKESSFKYTRPVLQSTLQLMGCKPRHALKISGTVFTKIRSEWMDDALVYANREMSRQDDSKGLDHLDEASNFIDTCLDNRSKNNPFELYKKRTTIVVRRKKFLDSICDALTEYKYMGPNQRADLALACRIRERKESVTVLLCGTSGCGKSTLSALLGSRLGITTVVSTDSIRHMMRSFVDEKQNPLLWASTYHAGEYLDPVAVAEAKAKRKENKLAGISTPPLQREGRGNRLIVGKSPFDCSIDVISSKQMAIEGYKAQSEMVIDSLDRLITAWEKRKESVIVEGVHLSLNFVMGLMKKHPSILPVMVYIANEEKHLERFAVRAKYMTLDPAKNKYVKYIRNIRTIQEYLCNRADKHLVPKINNTNVDRSVASIHATVFSCLRRREAGEQLYDPITNTTYIIDEEYKNQCAANCMSSKGMFQLIQRQGSSRQLMALMNDDGLVAKAWPVYTSGFDGKPILDSSFVDGTETPMYGPLHIGKAEPIHLQFGHFGINGWLSDTGAGTSHASSFDESRGDLTDNGSRYFSSFCTSPWFSDGHAKELKEEQSVHGSDDDEEVYEPPEIDSDEDPSDDDSRHIDEELEGSVNEDYTQSDEECDDDLATLDIQENGYLTDDYDKDAYNRFHVDETEGQKYKQNTDHFRSKSGTLSESPLDFHFCEKKVPTFGNVRTRKLSNNIPTHGQCGAFRKVYSFSEGSSSIGKFQLCLRTCFSFSIG